MGTLTAQAVTVKVCVLVIVEVTDPLSPPGAGVVAGPGGVDPEPEEPAVGAGLPEIGTPPEDGIPPFEEPGWPEGRDPLGEPGAPDVGTSVGKPEIPEEGKPVGKPEIPEEGKPVGKPERLDEGTPIGKPGVLSVGTPPDEPGPPEVGTPVFAGPEDVETPLE